MRASTTRRLRVDPVFGQLIGGRAAEKGVASVSQMARFKTEMLTARGNRHGLEALNREWVERAGTFTSKRPVILDLDSFESAEWLLSFWRVDVGQADFELLLVYEDGEGIAVAVGDSDYLACLGNLGNC